CVVDGVGPRRQEADRDRSRAVRLRICARARTCRSCSDRECAEGGDGEDSGRAIHGVISLLLRVVRLNTAEGAPRCEPRCPLRLKRCGRYCWAHSNWSALSSSQASTAASVSFSYSSLVTSPSSVPYWSSSSLICSMSSAASGYSSEKPACATKLSVSGSPTAPVGPSRSLTSYSLYAQNGRQSVTTMSSSAAIALSSDASMPAVDEVTSSYSSSSSYSGIIDSCVCLVSPAPGSMPMISPPKRSAWPLRSSIELMSSMYVGTAIVRTAPS